MEKPLLLLLLFPICCCALQQIFVLELHFETTFSKFLLHNYYYYLRFSIFLAFSTIGTTFFLLFKVSFFVILDESALFG